MRCIGMARYAFSMHKTVRANSRASQTLFPPARHTSSTLFRSPPSTLRQPAPLYIATACATTRLCALVQTTTQRVRTIPSSGARIFTSANALSRWLRDFTGLRRIVSFPGFFSGDWRHWPRIKGTFRGDFRIMTQLHGKCTFTLFYFNSAIGELFLRYTYI